MSSKLDDLAYVLGPLILTPRSWVDLILHRQGEEWQWQDEFHPRGPKVGGGFRSWLPYEETAAVSEPQAQDELKP